MCWNKLKRIFFIPLFTLISFSFSALAINFEALLPDEKNTIEIFQHSVSKVVYVHRLTTVKTNRHANQTNFVSSGTGSGIIWDHQGHIVTNFHVIKGADALTITMDKITMPARVIASEPRKDLAVLQVKSNKALEKIKLIPLFELVNNRDMVVGQKAIAIGNPFGLDHSLTVGVVSALNRQVPGVGGVNISHMIQTDAAINPGNSGGPLLDSQGGLLGLNTAIFSNSGSSAGIGFAVPAEEIQKVVSQLIQYGRIRFAGIGIKQASDDVAKRQGITKGVLIADILPYTPAARAGLKGMTRDHCGRMHLGDVLTAVNGHSIHNYNDFYMVLEQVNVGDLISLTVDRQGKLIDHDIKTIDIAAY